MRLNIIMLFLFISASASTLRSQQVTIQMNLSNTTVGKVIAVLQENTDYEFSYSSGILAQKLGTVSINAKDSKIENVLDNIFDNTNIKYQMKGNRILLYHGQGATENKQGTPPAGGKKQIRIAGTVVDTTGITLVGVTVQIKGTTKGTGTDINGNFILDVPENAALLFSYIGYKPVEMKVNGRKEVTVLMHTNDSQLDEVVVVGYGVQKKISMIGAQSMIEAKDVKIPVRNLSNSLAGRVAGLVSVQRKGEPGFDDANIYIRGISTFSNSMSKPLTLVDGVPRSFSDVDPEDIESFSILKDASATAVYGVRGANGVILINTKSGTAGRPKFNVRYTQGITQFTKVPQFADGITYMQMSNEASRTRGESDIYSPEYIESTRSGIDPYLYPNVDWFSSLYNQVGHNRSANANISGGMDRATYYIGIGYYDELGLYKTDELVKYNSSTYYRRYNITSNITLKPTSTTTLKLGIQGYLANANYPATGSSTIFENAFFMTPVSIAKSYPDGKIPDIAAGSVTNPYALLTQMGYANQWRNQLFSNLRLTQDLPFVTPGLSASGMFSFDVYNYTSNRNTKTPDTYQATGRDEKGNLVYNRTRVGTEYLSYARNSEGSRSIYGEFALNYNRTFKKFHTVSAMFLYNQSDEIKTQENSLIGALPYRFRGIAGRATYSFHDRYFVEGNFGYNGAENFAPGERYGFFPSGGGGWVISNEPFFESAQQHIQFIKVRGSYGIVGNSQISGRRFAYITTVDSPPGYSFGQTPGTTNGKEFGEYAVNVTWETARKANVGLDLTTMQNKLNIQVDFFKEHRTGIFLRRASIPDYAGIINSPYGNIGVIDNKGFEVSANYGNNWGDFSLQFLGNFAFNRNKVIEDDSPTWKYPWLERKGQRVGQRFGYIALGLFESEEEVAASPKQTGKTLAGDIKYKDINGDGQINSDDQIPIGYGSIPEVNYGFGLTLGYKNFSLSALFQGVGNVDAMLSGEGMMPFSQGFSRGNLFSNITDRWTEENPSQDVFYPRLMGGVLNANFEQSTWWLKSTSYMRLKNLQVTYKFPQKWVKKVHMKNAEIFLQGVNLLTFSKFKLWDVEMGDGRGANYPNVASYSIGINLNF